MTTCSRCLDGRHVRCTDKASCACTICSSSSRGPTRKTSTFERSSRRTVDRRIAMPGVGRGNNPAGWRPAGTSSLAAPAQRIAEIMFDNGAGDSEVGTALGCSREVARTVRLRGMGLTHRGARGARVAA